MSVRMGQYGCYGCVLAHRQGLDWKVMRGRCYQILLFCHLDQWNWCLTMGGPSGVYCFLPRFLPKRRQRSSLLLGGQDCLLFKSSCGQNSYSATRNWSNSVPQDDASNELCLLFLYKSFLHGLLRPCWTNMAGKYWANRLKICPKASLIVPDFSISVQGSSCNFFFLYHSFFLSVYFMSPCFGKANK